MRPFISNTSSSSGASRIILQDGDNIVSDPYQVAEIFNLYYAAIAEYRTDPDGLNNTSFGEIILKHILHDSIQLIKCHVSISSEFHFTPISPDTLYQYIRGIPSNRAPGHDGLSIKFIKMFNLDNVRSLCNIFNECIRYSCFPTPMKLSKISPIFKKNDSLCKENYRSVNVLTCLSKVFERILADQFLEYFKNLLSPYLSAYRKGYSCQHVLLQLTEFWSKPWIGGRPLVLLPRTYPRLLTPCHMDY